MTNPHPSKSTPPISGITVFPIISSTNSPIRPFRPTRRRITVTTTRPYCTRPATTVIIRIWKIVKAMNQSLTWPITSTRSYRTRLTEIFQPPCVCISSFFFFFNSFYQNIITSQISRKTVSSFKVPIVTIQWQTHWEATDVHADWAFVESYTKK